MSMYAPENWHGLAGPPMAGEDIGHDWWYVWGTGGSWADPKRVILDKLRSQDVDAAYITALGTLAANDPLTGSTYRRYWILFNEPDSGSESNWAANPWGAAEWYRKAFVAIRNANAYTVIGAPSLMTIQDDGTTILVWDPVSGTNRSWLDLFLEALDAENASKPGGDPNARIEFYTVHASDNYVSYHFSRMENHITRLRGVLAVAYDCIDVAVDIWITECSALTGSAEINLGWMDRLTTWLGEKGFDTFGVKRVAWFVSFDAWWWSHYPGCSLWQPVDGTYELTALGQLWKEMNSAFKHGPTRVSGIIEVNMGNKVSLGRPPIAGIFEMWKDLGKGPFGVTFHGLLHGIAQRLHVSATVPAVVYSGVATVAVPTTRVVLGGSQSLEAGVKIMADRGNNGTIYVGGAAVAAANGYRLLSGEWIFVAAHNVHDIWLDASNGGDAVSWSVS